MKKEYKLILETENKKHTYKFKLNENKILELWSMLRRLTELIETSDK